MFKHSKDRLKPLCASVIDFQQTHLSHYYICGRPKAPSSIKASIHRQDLHRAERSLGSWSCRLQSKTLPEAQRTQGIESITWVNISTRIVWNWFQWNYLNWLQIWTPDGATSIDYKFGHPMAPIALVPNLTTRCHHLHWLPIWPLDGATRISYKVGHQMAPLA